MSAEKERKEQDDELFVVAESDDAIEGERSLWRLGQNAESLIAEGDDAKGGSLVKQLEETRTKLVGEDDSKMEAKISVHRHLNVFTQDISKLRENIQKLTQLVTPLGKTLDYLQEDINSMLSEMRTWQEEYKKNVSLLEEQRNSIDSDLEPLKVQLDQMDSEIKRVRESITTRRASILRNDEKIENIMNVAIERT